MITGECFCGTVKYQIDGPLGDGKSCHCSRCRKAFSAQASAAAVVDAKDFKWICGAENLTSFVGGHGFGFQFCRTCGSTLCTIYNGDVFQVMLGCLNGNPAVEIKQHIYVGSKAGWEKMPAGVTCFDEGAD